MRKKRSFLKLIVVAAVVPTCVSVLLHPYGAVKRDGSSRPILSGARIDSQTARLFERSCQSCHSQRTAWPWYSYMPVVSWLIERDVSQARQYMNLSRWDDYTGEERQAYLGAIAAAIRNNEMPPARFVLLHPEAVLTRGEREQIYVWARGERRRLKSPIHQSSAIAGLR